MPNSAPKNLKITAATVLPEVPNLPNLLELPWGNPLVEWDSRLIASLSKGASRHEVRFIHLGKQVLVVKETTAEMAAREYKLLLRLYQAGAPCVQPLAVVDGRTRSHMPGSDLAYNSRSDALPGLEAGAQMLERAAGNLPAALVTLHLQFSLPYRYLYSQTLQPETATRLVDALAVLLVKLHLIGFFWGDVSLSNTLFRRDAGAFAAYLVDAETGNFFPDGISDSLREHDLELARTNIAGELTDILRSGQDSDIDPLAISERINLSYQALWEELTRAEQAEISEQRWRINSRVRRLNQLGFDVEEMLIAVGENGCTVQIKPKVVDAGHHRRRLLRLTGIDSEDNQARRLLNDLDSYANAHDLSNEEVSAHQWLSGIYKPVVATIPSQLKRNLPEVEIFYGFLEHRWRLSEEKQCDISLAEALDSFIAQLTGRLEPNTGVIQLALPGAQQGTPVDWRKLV